MSSETRHTPGPIINEGETPRGVMLLAGPEDRKTIIYLYGPERQQYARLIAAAPELLTELQAAHQIIRNALAVMSTKQKLEWGRRNARDGVEGEGVTRANEREAVIARATGQEG